jgi:hypothetical protein
VVQKEAYGKWRVRWWRGNKFQTDSESAGIEPGGIYTVELPDIVDSLWLLQTERRKIRVSFLKYLIRMVQLTSRIFHSSLENGPTRMKLEQLRTSSPTHLRFPTRTKSIKLLNYMQVSCKGFSPHQTVHTTKPQAKSYLPRSGFKTITRTSVQQSFTMLEPYQSSRGHRFQIGLKLILDESRMLELYGWAAYQLHTHTHSSLHIG